MMRDLIERSLSAKIDKRVVVALLDSYQKMVIERTLGGRDECLTQAGKFVEHTLRAIEFLRVGVAPAEIKRPSDTVKEIAKDKALADSLRVLIPSIAYSMIYEIRSKRGAVHVKEIDPREIDMSLSVQAASWIVAEFLRLFHTDKEADVSDAMDSLMRLELPFIETIGGETVVTAKVSCPIELLLLIARASPRGVDRKSLGLFSKNGSSTVSKTIQRLAADKYIHRTADGLLHITGPGERLLSKSVANLKKVA